ncbi:MAG: ABC transporter ATP-binding protein [Alphaproteobacteria bacterium]|nr:ABC transporter ATP-binding protein [Alphaproteobacteria bacterium]
MLELDLVAKRFANGHLAVAAASLVVRESELVAIVGGSGCGKSTLLRLIAGLERPSAGQVRLAGRPIEGPSPEIGIVFQEPRLMPWLSVADNVRFGLAARPRIEADKAVREVLRRVGLEDFAKAWPRELSGGMAQRVAIARALVTRPKALLLDEPFSALDAFTRLDLQDHLIALWNHDRPTMVLVTHDIDEAIALGDRVLVMGGRPGRIYRELSIAAPRPRDRTAPAFVQAKRAILDDLRLARRPAAEPADGYAI